MQGQVRNVMPQFTIGEITRDAPKIVDTGTVGAGGGTFGYAFTRNVSTGVCAAGGTLSSTVIFAGIAIHPNAASLVSGNLTPSLAIPANSEVQLLRQGFTAVALAAAANRGDWVVYEQATGALSTLAAGGTAPTGWAIIPNARVVTNVNNAGAGIAEISLDTPY